MASQSGRRTRNKLGLKLNVSPEPGMENNLTDTTIDDNQLQRLKYFTQSKEKVGDMKRDDFIRLEEIGSGSAGTVFKVKHKKTDLIMAQKLIRLEVKVAERNKIIRELQVLHECNSPFIVGFFGAFHEDGEIYIMMEYMNCGSLDKIKNQVNRIPENILSKVAHDIVHGLSYLRVKHQVIHRDVKPSNVLINTNGEVKMCDFGVSGQLIDSMANSFVGTHSYMAPERLQGTKYSVRSDVWSLGLVLVELAVGRYPYPIVTPERLDLLIQDKIANNYLVLCIENENELSIFALLDMIVNGELPKLPEKHFSKQFINFIILCLVKNPGERADLDVLSTHEYLKKHFNVDVGSWVQKAFETVTSSIPN